MRLLFVHERFGALGGAEANLHLTAGELKRLGHTVALLHGEPTGKDEPGWRDLFAERFALPPAPLAATATALQTFRPDAVCVHKLPDLGALRVLVACGLPLVRMVHDHDVYCMRSYKYHPLTRRICRRPASAYCVFPCGASLARNRGGPLPFRWISYVAKREEIALNRRFHRLMVATEFMRAELLANGFAAPQIEIHPPVPPPADGSAISSFSDRNLLVFSGQIIRGKGVDVLLRALARVAVPFECVILGDGNHRAKCEQLCRKLGLQARVSFKGYVPQAQVKSFYTEASAALVSSVWPEPFGMVGIEAMRYGLPVVAFDAGGIQDWLRDGETGFLVPWMDVAQYAARVEQLLRGKTLARTLGEHGRQFAAERYDFARYIRDLEDLFARVIRETQDPARS